MADYSMNKMAGHPQGDVGESEHPHIHIHSHSGGHTVHVMHPDGTHTKHEHEKGDADGIAAHIHEHIGSGQQGDEFAGDKDESREPPMRPGHTSRNTV